MRILARKKKKRNKTMVAWQKKRSVQGDREGKKRRTAVQVHDSFNSKMQCQIK